MSFLPQNLINMDTKHSIRKKLQKYAFSLLCFLSMLTSRFIFILYVSTHYHLLQVFNGSPNTVDGCATFFRRDRFSHVKKYEVDIHFISPKKIISICLTQSCPQVEFNKAAQSLTDAVIPTGQKKPALNRLIKVGDFLVKVRLFF